MGNDPVLLAVLVILVVIIAVGLILYFLVFKQKLDAKRKVKQESANEKQKKDDAAQNVASEIFKGQEKPAATKPSDVVVTTANTDVDFEQKMQRYTNIGSKDMHQRNMAQFDAPRIQEKEESGNKTVSFNPNTGFNYGVQYLKEEPAGQAEAPAKKETPKKGGKNG